MRHLTLLRILVVVAAVLVIEGLCRIGVIGRFTMQPPSEIIRDLYRVLASGKFNAAIMRSRCSPSTRF
jgi:NitT/TauT family transport system permease protein